MPIAAAAVRTHRRRAGSARQSSTARHRPSHLPATAIAPVTNTWSYNRRRLPTAETQTPDGTRSWSLTYGYNAQGQRTSETAPDNVTTTYTVNALGQTTQISVKVKNATTTVASNASYYPNGALQQFTYGNGITHTLTQNARQLPQRSQDGSVLDLTTTFDANGNVASIVDGTANARQSRSMAYDGLDRLTQVQSPMFGTASYGYDAQDNLRHVGISGGSQPRDHTYCYSADNRLEFVRSGPNCTGTASPAVIALGYDPQGNLQFKNGTAYSFDYGNRLRNTANRNYRYDAAGRRVRTDSAGSQLQYSDYASDGRLVWQRDEAAGKRINNIYLAGSLVAEVSRSLTTDVATYRYVHTDALGSPIAKTSSTGAILETSEYEPYGALLNRANDDRVGYTGHVMDSGSGLIYMQARYYDPMGVFLSVDPVSADTVTGWNFCRYCYANNNPYKFTDPDGREVRLQWHEVVVAGIPTGMYHTFLRITPSNQAAHQDSTTFNNKNSKGQSFATIGAGNDANFKQSLAAGINRPTEIVPHEGGIAIPTPAQYKNEDAFVSALFGAAANFMNNTSQPGNRIDYDFAPNTPNAASPLLADDGFNSNSFTSGLLQATGAKIPQPPVIVPGFQKPVPDEVFRKK